MWKVVGASVAGASHEAAGKGCEDAMGWRVGVGVTCLAVADGAGSRARSGRGACLAVERAVLLSSGSPSEAGAECAVGTGRLGVGAAALSLPPRGREEWLGVGAAALSLPPRGREERRGAPAERGGDVDLGGVLRRIFADVREQIGALAAIEGGSADSYATTLAVAIATSAEVGIAQIGDTIAVTGYRGCYLAADPEPPTDYVNETMFITEPGAPEQIRITILPADKVDTVVLATDGLRFKILADLATGAPYVPFFEDLETYVRSPAATDQAIARFLTALDDQANDDKTLLAAVATDISRARTHLSRGSARQRPHFGYDFEPSA